MGKRASSIELSNEEREYLKLQTRARTIQAQTVTRARILLLRADSVSIDAIADKVGLNRCSVMLCLKKFKEGGIENALFDAPGRGRNAEITDEEKAEICKLPICDSQMYSDSIYKNKYGMIFISILTDANLGVYRNKNNGAVFAFGEYIYPLTDKAMWKKYINKEVYTANCDFKEKDLQKIAEEYEFLGRLTPKQTAENLRFIYEHIKTDTELVILLGCEREYKDNKLEAWVNRHNDHKEYNSAVRKEFDGCKNVTLFDVNEYITSDDDFNDSVNHYKKRVYYLMAQKFTEMINAHANADVAKQTSKAKLAYLTLKQKIKKIVKPNG